MMPHVFTCGDEVLHVVTTGANETEVLQVIEAAHSIPQFVGCIAEYGNWRSAAHDIDVNTVKEVAQTSFVIIVGAYDGESYVIAELADRL
jgi:hypothetical protein